MKPGYDRVGKKSVLALDRQVLVEVHGQLAHQVEHEHDTDRHQHHTGTDFHQADIFAEAVEGHQELVEQQAGNKERDAETEGIDRKQADTFADLTRSSRDHQD